MKAKGPCIVKEVKLLIGCLLCFTLGWYQTFAQQRYTPANIHSHNDYTRDVPFYHAYNAGTGCIEADVFLRDKELMVSHDTAHITFNNTLRKMYLEPLQKELAKHPRPIKLFIDLKESYVKLLPELVHELKPLDNYINKGDGQAPLTIVITGDFPPPALFKNYPSYILFDDNLQLPYTPEQWKRVAEVSLNFANYSKWKATDILPARDEKVLKSVINAVHIAGKPIRFWGAPDNPAAWKKLMELGADVINTDKIDELVNYMQQ